MYRTKRLIIRPFREDDAADLYEYLSREETYRFEPGKPVTWEKAAEMAREFSQGTNFWAATLQREPHKLIGHVSLFQAQPDFLRTWEIGYIFNPDFQGRGYATEATLAVIAHTFNELGAHRITGCCSPENVPSWKVLEKCGLRREGLYRKNFLHHEDESGNPVWFDSYIYALLDEEFQPEDTSR